MGDKVSNYKYLKPFINYSRQIRSLLKDFNLDLIRKEIYK